MKTVRDLIDRCGPSLARLRSVRGDPAVAGLIEEKERHREVEKIEKPAVTRLRFFRCCKKPVRGLSETAASRVLPTITGKAVLLFFLGRRREKESADQKRMHLVAGWVRMSATPFGNAPRHR